MKVIFDRSNGTELVLGEATNKKEATKLINDFMDAHNYHSPYWRLSLYEDEKYVWIDTGSWSEFFRVVDMTDEQLNEWRC